ncbi:glycosyltransferase family 4 protein [Acetobacter sp. AC2005]|uniref:glycosyltransferase family 4 protein n=1 Tax=Acetobacter sp. AC2005 TaxID=3134142 RepID=UPI0030CA74B2
MKIAFLVQGLFSKSDSIGYDCVYEYKRFRTMFPDNAANIYLFAERSDPDRYPDISICNMEAFYKWCEEYPEGIIIYHYCGAWKEVDDFLVRRPTRSVVRWHNNTSPWFYLSEEGNLSHTVEGLENIVRIVDKPNLFFWMNSSFTREQFLALGGQATRAAVVFPASRYLEKPASIKLPNRQFAPDDIINMLFVGRVVRHKGHQSIMSVAERVHKVTGKGVIVRFAGREDKIRYELEKYAKTLEGIEVHFYGEVSEEELEELYRISDVFLCLSEHEGFGLPVFEAMRCGLPVIAWSTTALRELMADHPLGFHFYDLNMFAAAVQSLNNRDVYDAVIAAQDKVLQIYTANVVDNQLQKALNAFLMPASHDSFVESFPNTLTKYPVLANAVATKMETMTAQPNEASSKIHDSGYNLFSRYDIKTFSMLSERANRLKFAAFENYSNNGEYKIEPEEFHHHRGQMENGVLYFPLGKYNAGHIIFGPYIALAANKYVIKFDFRICVSGPVVPDLKLDVQSRKNGQLALEEVKIENDQRMSVKMIFDNPDSDDILEFRFDFTNDFEGEFTFYGATLKAIS